MQTFRTKPSGTVLRWLVLWWLVLSPHSKVPGSNPLADRGLSGRSLHVLPLPVLVSFAYFSFLSRLSERDRERLLVFVIDRQRVQSERRLSPEVSWDWFQHPHPLNQ